MESEWASAEITSAPRRVPKVSLFFRPHGANSAGHLPRPESTTEQ